MSCASCETPLSTCDQAMQCNAPGSKLSLQGNPPAPNAQRAAAAFRWLRQPAMVVIREHMVRVPKCRRLSVDIQMPRCTRR
jgi:hypothetical protein